MIEIIPNWHPLLVHFTVGLLSTSSLFYVASAFLSHTNSWKQQWLNMANWSLWSGCLFAIGTAFAGWLAYNSVAHDSASHAAMTLHRNWALPTASTFLLLGLWAIFNARKNRRPGFLFLTFSIIAAGLLMVTGWLGAEAVYRYGLGVKSLPVVAEGADGHNHSHGSEHDESAMDEAEHQHGITNIEQPLSEDGHQHSHANNETPPEIGQTNQPDGHQHEHGEQTLLQEQPVKEDAHQHSHENKKISPATKQVPKQGGHQHEHESKNTRSKIEHAYKTTTENNAEPTIKSTAIEPHTHDSNSIGATTSPIDQDKTSNVMPLSPSELHSLPHADEQNEETHDQGHKH